MLVYSSNYSVVVLIYVVTMLSMLTIVSGTLFRTRCFLPVLLLCWLMSWCIQF